MNILIVTTSYPLDAADNSGIFIKRLAVEMVRQGANVTVLAPGHKSAPPRETDQGIHVVRYGYAPRPMMQLAYSSGGIFENLRRRPFLIALLPFFLLSFIIHAVILAGKSHIIHANWLLTGLFALPAKMIGRKPLVVTLRGSDVTRPESRAMVFLKKRFDALTTVNEKWAADLKTERNMPVFYTPNGVDVSSAAKREEGRRHFGFFPEEIIVVCVGALILRKGTDNLAETARILSDKGISMRFVLAGPGDPDEFCLNDLPNLTHIGSLPPDEVLTLFASGDIFFLPSRHEGRPNSLLEAMASGLPSVATNLPGVREVLTEACGIIIPMEDSRAMALAIETLALSPADRETMGSNATARIRELSLDWRSSAANYLRIFEEMVSCAELPE